MCRRASLSLALCCAVVAAAQRPHWRTTLPPVQQSGLHAVRLSPEVVGRSKPGLQDIRLMAPDSTLVPYVVRTEPEAISAARAIPFAVLRNERVGRRTVVEFEVPAGTLVDGLELGIRNAQVDKRARITGSDDRLHWYMVKDEGLTLTGEGEARSLRWMDLPLSDHRYYRIELNDSLTPPVQVLSVGHTMQARSEGHYVSAGQVRWDRLEEKGHTLFRIYGGHPLVIDRIHYTTTDTLPYRRQAELYTMRSEWRTERRQGKVLHRWREDLGTGILASDQRTILQGPGMAVDNLYIAVRNGDDRPLSITTLDVLQRQRTLLAPLGPGITYTLTTGDPEAAAPQFDMAYFSDSLPPIVATLQLPALIPVAAVEAEEVPFDLSSVWVWIAIVVVGGLSAFAAVRALRNGPPAN